VIQWTCQLALLRWCWWNRTQVEIHNSLEQFKSVGTAVYLQSRKSPHLRNSCTGTTYAIAKEKKNEFPFHTMEAYAPYNSLLVLITLVELIRESSSGMQACS
jgi:hypothetical protein